MNLCQIKKVIMSCPVCNTGIKLDLTSKDDAAMEKLIAASENFACPVCETKFGGAHKLLGEVNTYNKFVAELGLYNKAFDVEFE